MSSALDKVDNLLDTLKSLSSEERRDAVAALKDAGLGELASALQSVLGRGSRPPERPDPDHTPSN